MLLRSQVAKMFTHGVHYDSAPKPSTLNEEDSIQAILNTIGVKYSHLNDEILLPSRIEEERTKKSLMACVYRCL